MIREILVMHHSHTDIGFTHPQPVWWELSRRYIDEALDLCEHTSDYPEDSRMKWTCENTTPLLHWLEHASSRQVERFAHAARGGQISVAALPANLTILPDLEQLTRGLQPVKRLREEFGLPVKCAITHDVNGVAWPLNQLLLDAGIELFIMGTNTHFGGFPLHRPLVFNWQGMDGRSLLSHNGLVYTMFDGITNMRQRSVEAMAAGLDHYVGMIPPDYPFDYLFLTATHRPWHNDNNPPNPWLPDLIKQWNGEGRQPRIRLITPDQYLQRLRQEPEEKFPTCSGDWTDYWSFGVGSAAFETRAGQRVRSRLAAAGLAGVAIGQNKPGYVQEEKEGYEALNLWAEHTWAADDSLTEPDSVYTREQWAHKLSYLYQARSQAQLLMRDRLEELCGNPRHATGLKGILVFNPAPVARKEFFRLPAQVIPQQVSQGEWMHFSSIVMRLDQYLELNDLKDSGVLVGPVELPANGWRVLSIESLKPASIPEGVSCAEGWLESASHQLSYDPLNGKVLSLVEKETGWHALDENSPWDFGGLVWEHVDPKHPAKGPHYGRDAFFELNRWDKIEAGEECWKADWPAVREKPGRLLECRSELTPLGPVLIRRWAGAGVEHIEQRITLLAHRPSIRIDVQLRLPERIAAEAYYLTFPFNLSGWRAHYDTADLPVELDAEQLPGACRDWQCVTRWASLHNPTHGITLACPDAPLVQFGGFNWAKHSRTIPGRENALLLGWLANNYWNCNFPAAQPGFVRFHYELVTHGPYDPAKSIEVGTVAAAAVEVHPLLGDRITATGQVIKVSGEGVVLLYAGIEEDGAVRVRLFNSRSTNTPASVTFPGRRLKHAEQIDTLGRPIAVLSVHSEGAGVIIAPRSILQLRIGLG